MNKRFSDTLDFYDANAADYAENMPPDEASLAALEAFQQMLPPGARVLDLGCGAGHYAARLLAAGFDVDLLDGSTGLAAEAEKRTGRTVRIARFEELADRETYDGIWASASLLHADANALPGIVSRVAAALKPGGVLYASFKDQEADQIDTLGRHYVAMTEPKLETLLVEAGMKLFSMNKARSVGYNGAESAWLYALARKRA